MFDGNPLTVKGHLKDLERAFEPRISDYRAEQSPSGRRVAVSLLLVVIVAIGLGGAHML